MRILSLTMPPDTADELRAAQFEVSYCQFMYISLNDFFIWISHIALFS